MLKWHKEIIEKIRVNWGITHYQLYWLAFVKGLVIGIIIMML